MTDLTDRLDAIQKRIEAATPGPWEFEYDEITNAPDYASERPAPWTQVMECEVSCRSYCYGGSINMAISPENRTLIANAPSDVAFLLDLVRKQQDELDSIGDIA